MNPLFSAEDRSEVPHEDLPHDVISINAQIKQAPAGEQIRVGFIGASTFEDFDPGRTPMRGIGQVAPAFFNDHVSFLNAARSGASTKSFLLKPEETESAWEKIAVERWAKIQEFKPDYLFIHFAHNDQKSDPRRATDHKTTFRDNLRTFIRTARAWGGTPVLLTPVARRTYYKDTGRAKTILQPWADAMRAVAQEENVILIDLHGKSLALYDSLGDEYSAWINCCKETDRTHFSEKGAMLMFKFIKEELPLKLPELAQFLKQQED